MKSSSCSIHVIHARDLSLVGNTETTALLLLQLFIESIVLIYLQFFVCAVSEMLLEDFKAKKRKEKNERRPMLSMLKELNFSRKKNIGTCPSA